MTDVHRHLSRSSDLAVKVGDLLQKRLSLAQEQFTDPVVSRTKFERELAEYHVLSHTYRQRGWLLLKAEYPQVLVAFAAPQTNPLTLVLGVALDYTNYDAAPPSVKSFTP